MLGGSVLSRDTVISLFATASRLALGPVQPPVQWVPRVLYLLIKWLEHEVDHSPQPNAKVKNMELYLYIYLLYFIWHCNFSDYSRSVSNGHVCKRALKVWDEHFLL
jgi:hypothetical protein